MNNPELYNNDMAQHLLRHRDKCLEKDICAFCNISLSSVAFEDFISIEECFISSLCQQCQDEVFEEDRNDQIKLNITEEE